MLVLVVIVMAILVVTVVVIVVMVVVTVVVIVVMVVVTVVVVVVMVVVFVVVIVVVFAVLLVVTLFAIAPPTVSVRPLEGIVITVASTMEDGPESMIKMTMVESEIMVRVVQCKRPGRRSAFWVRSKGAVCCLHSLAGCIAADKVIRIRRFEESEFRVGISLTTFFLHLELCRTLPSEKLSTRVSFLPTATNVALPILHWLAFALFPLTI